MKVLNWWRSLNLSVKIMLIFFIAETIFFMNFKVIFGFGTSMEPTISNGTVLMCKKQSSYKVGDIVYYTINGNHVVHRIIEVRKYELSDNFYVDGYILQGDNNQSEDSFMIFKENIVCRVV